VSNGGPAYMFQWEQNGNPVGSNLPQYSSSTLANGDIITCQIIIPGTGCSAGGTVTSNEITMTVSPTPAPTLQIVASVNKICAGDPVIFTANALNAGLTPSYEWKLNGNAVGSGAANYENDNLASGDKVSCILLPGQVSCPLTGDILSNTLIIPVNPLPVVVFNPPAISIAIGQRAQLHAVISGSPGTYQWSPASELVDAATLDPFTVPLTSTTTYQLQAISGDGCKAVQDIVVKALSKFNMPNSFTPNGDGRNDLFRIPPGTFFNLEVFSIFDRWGNMVFSTRDRSQGWDGWYNGHPSPSGTYVYFISGSEGGKPEVIKGTVLLVR
jgi:gliding motility-associated-like protein